MLWISRPRKSISTYCTVYNLPLSLFWLQGRWCDGAWKCPKYSSNQMLLTWLLALLTRCVVHGYSGPQSPHKAPFQRRFKNTPVDTDTVTLCKIDDSQMNSYFGGTMIACSVHGVLFKTTLKWSFKTSRDPHTEGMHMTLLEYLNDE